MKRGSFIVLGIHPSQDNCAMWSPDGKRIASISDRDGGHDVYMMEVKKN
jgi:Tol biopolymer transport system component